MAKASPRNRRKFSVSKDLLMATMRDFGSISKCKLKIEKYILKVDKMWIFWQCAPVWLNGNAWSEDVMGWRWRNAWVFDWKSISIITRALLIFAFNTRLKLQQRSRQYFPAPLCWHLQLWIVFKRSAPVLKRDSNEFYATILKLDSKLRVDVTTGLLVDSGNPRGSWRSFLPRNSAFASHRESIPRIQQNIRFTGMLPRDMGGSRVVDKGKLLRTSFLVTWAENTEDIMTFLAAEMPVLTEKSLRSPQGVEIILRDLLAWSIRVGGLWIWPHMVPKRGHLAWKSVGCLESPPNMTTIRVWRHAFGRGDNRPNKTFS